MWLTLTLCSFVAFLGAMLAFTRRGVAPDGSLRRAGRVFLVAAVISALMWAYSLSKVAPPYPTQNLKRFEAPRFPLRPQRS